MNLADWFSSPMGMRALKTERVLLKRVLASACRNDLLQIGGPIDPTFVASFGATLRYHYLSNTLLSKQSVPMICANYEALPIRSGSMDVVLSVHSLEKLAIIENALLDIYRILKPEGQVIITGLHRFSFWRLLSPPQKFPKNTHFYSIDAVSRILTQIGFSVVQEQTACFRLPSQKRRWLFLEMLGQLLLPFMGGVYMIVATKNEKAITPVFESLKMPVKGCANV